VLKKSSDKVRLCYQLAAEARARAQQETDAARKERFFEIEARYIRLAQSHELTESLADFGREARRFGREVRRFLERR